MDERKHTESDFSFGMIAENDGYGYIENEGKVIYSVDRNKIIELEDILVKGNILQEKLFLFENLIELESRCSPPDTGDWLLDYMAESNYCDLEEGNMRALYEETTKYYDPKLESDEKIINISFIGFWSVSMSQGYEDLYPEIDYIEYTGAGKVVGNK